MIKNLKKAFTIIELVIVIAVIAILAAVMIPTYSSLVEKANQLADIQAVKQMNTILALDEVDSIKSIANVHEALNAEGLDSENFTPLASNTYFYWLEKENRIVYVDKENNVIYPEDLKDKIDLNVTEGNEKYRYYCSLNGVIKTQAPSWSTDSDGNKTATVTTAEQLYYLSTKLDSSVKTIKFDVAEIDAHGADISLNFKGFDGQYTIESATNGTTIKNAVSFSKDYSYGGNDYASGFITYVDSAVSLKISNITIDGGIFGDLETGGVGALIGRIEVTEKSGRSVEISKCTVKNAIINGKNKVGALIGSIGGNKNNVEKISEVIIEGCKVEDCTVNCSEGESGKAIGGVYHKVKLTINEEFSQWVIGKTTLNLIATDKREQVAGSNLQIELRNSETYNNDCEIVVRQLDDNGEPKIKSGKKAYRMFADAYMTAQMYTYSITVVISSNSDSVSSKVQNILLNNEACSIEVLKFYK